ncbi:mismatch repair endonuclease PMS2-like [Oppia nitens]|uniref:mismatch repair endonuclease PMS2-like n=1 Tax=Oppia nitens TaxID=1686743 RepID=UPI0023D97F8B|nr:mismatch repair endonuclease PMS2-like [Oppia nitens]
MDGHERRIKAIDNKTAKTICSAQVITSITNVVKELLENAIDAEATVITIRLKEFGKDIIEITDNGIGIDEQDFSNLCKRHFTSKLNDFEELPFITSYGFRGEALNSLANMSDLLIQTRHLSQAIGSSLKFDSDGNVISREAVARNVGTTVSIQNLFYKIPVRRKEFHKNIKREFDKMIRLVIGYCVGTVGLRINLTNQMNNKPKQTLLSSPGLSTKNNIIEVFDSKQLNQLIDFNECQQLCGESEQTLRISGLISKCDTGCGRAATDRQFFYVNHRPCDVKNIQKFINDIYRTFNRNQYPFILANIEINKNCVDFNLSPDKRQLLIANEDQIFAIIKDLLFRLYNKETNCQLTSMTKFTSNVRPISSLERSVDEEVTEMTSQPLNIPRCRSPCDSLFKEINREAVVVTPPITPRIDTEIENTSKKSNNNNPKSFTTAMNVLNEHIIHRPPVRVSNESSSNVSHVIQRQSNNIIPIDSNSSYQNACPLTQVSVPIIVREVPMSSQSEVITCGQSNKRSTDSLDSSKPKKCMTECSIMIDDDCDNDYNDNTIGNIVDIDIESIKAQYLKTTLKNNESTIDNRFTAKIQLSQNEVAENELNNELKKSSFEEMLIIGQFNLGFIITKLSNDLFIVDQHASNERFNYEKLLEETVIENQKLVAPLPLELSSANEQVVIDHLNTFKSLGFGIFADETAKPGHRLYLATLPISKEWTAGKEDIEEIVGTIIETPIELLANYKLNGFKKVIASRACRSSVMIGESLFNSQMKTIVTQMSQLMNPWHCAHNRPTIRHLINLSNISMLSNNCNNY